MSKTLVEIASEIVQAQASLSTMASSEIATSLRQVFSTLQELQKSESEGIDLQQANETSEAAPQDNAPTRLTRENSILNDKIICLECGAEMRQLTQKHLITHGLTPKEYKKKHGFAMRTPLAAKSLTKARSKAAKKRGLPENLVKFLEAKKLANTAETLPPDTAPQSGVPADSRNAAGGARLRKKVTPA